VNQQLNTNEIKPAIIPIKPIVFIGKMLDGVLERKPGSVLFRAS